MRGSTLSAGERVALRPSARIETVRLAEGAVMLVDTDSGGCWQLNRVGGEVWELFQNADAAGAGISLMAVAAAVAARYPTAGPGVDADVHEIVRDLSAQGLLVPAAPG